MNVSDQLHGAWRIEEAPRRRGRDHPYGFPHTHWLILGNRGVVIRDRAAAVLDFDFLVRTDESTTPKEVVLGGQHGGCGFYELDGDMLLISLGVDWVRPPRFASDCGLAFALLRDPQFALPPIPRRSRDPIHSPTLGELVWDRREPEWAGEWTGQVTLSGQNECEIWVSDYLMSIERFLPKIERTCQWLREHLNEVQAACVEIIEDWVDEDDDLSSLSSQAIAETISITSISASNGAVELWAGTTIPIDHSLRVHLNYDGPRITIAGVSIEG